LKDLKMVKKSNKEAFERKVKESEYAAADCK
jgi:hypothetical protein